MGKPSTTKMYWLCTSKITLEEGLTRTASVGKPSCHLPSFATRTFKVKKGPMSKRNAGRTLKTAAGVYTKEYTLERELLSARSLRKPMWPALVSVRTWKSILVSRTVSATWVGGKLFTTRSYWISTDSFTRKWGPTVPKLWESLQTEFYPHLTQTHLYWKKTRWPGHMRNPLAFGGYWLK